jgi:hypothetical protein
VSNDFAAAAGSTRVRVPARDVAEALQIVLRLDDVESAAFAGITLKSRRHWVREWAPFASVGVAIGWLAAVGVVLAQSTRRSE